MGHGINNIIYQLSSSLNTAKKTDFYSENIRFKPKGFTLFVNFKGSLVQYSGTSDQYITHHSAIGRFDIPFSSVEQQISTDSLANSLSGNLFMEFAKAQIQQFQLAMRTNKSADQTIWNNWYHGNGITTHAKNVQNPKLSQTHFKRNN